MSVMICENCSKLPLPTSKGMLTSNACTEGASSSVSPARAARGCRWSGACDTIWSMTFWRMSSKALRYLVAAGTRSAMTKSTMLQSWMPLLVAMSKMSEGQSQMQYTKVRPAINTFCRAMNE